MRYFVYYAADGDIREITPLRISDDPCIEVDFEQVAGFFTAEENPSLWYVTSGTKELKKKKQAALMWRQRALNPFGPYNEETGLVAQYGGGTLRFHLQGDDFDQYLGARFITVLVTPGNDPYIVLRSLDLNHTALFAGPVEITVGTLPERFGLFLVEGIFSNLMLVR